MSKGFLVMPESGDREATKRAAAEVPTTLTSEQIAWGYRYLLGREPEFQAVMAAQARNHPDWRSFRDAVLKSVEFEGIQAQRLGQNAVEISRNPEKSDAARRTPERMSGPPKLNIPEAIALFKGLLWREPSEAEIERLKFEPHSLAIISTIWETEEFRRAVAPRLAERALGAFAVFFPDRTEKYLQLCSDLREGILPNGSSRRPDDIVFLAYILCLHRPADPLGFVQYTDNVARGVISVATLVRSLLNSGEAAATLVSDPPEDARTISEFAACLKHKWNSAECVI